MKIVRRDILPFQERDFFAPIRDKVGYARLVLYSARQLLLNIDTSSYESFSNLTLIVDKMSRLFVYKNEKYFSVSFPFSILTEDEDDIISEMSTPTGTLITNEIISSAVSIINNEQFKLKPSPMEFFIQTDSLDELGLFLLEEIFMFEPSYVRYDVDEENFNGKIHPLIHLDVNYSSQGTYKIGLDKKILTDEFENILNIKTECSFLSNI